ncbi:hypothetical protein EDF21_2045 [Frigoribacterium sp. PhB118]|nr:hypothetical protein EDF21_2045 [Frigoribacterium sp. PhB118]
MGDASQGPLIGGLASMTGSAPDGAGPFVSRDATVTGVTGRPDGTTDAPLAKGS